MALVLIVGDSKDAQVERVARQVRRRGGRALICDTRAFPEAAFLSLGDGEVVWRRGRLSEPSAVYLRGLGASPLAPEFEQDLATRPRGLLAQCEEKAALLASMVLTLQACGVPLVNTLEANAQHRRKPYQLELLRARGLPVPRYLCTNDPRAARRFVREVGQAVYKPVAGGATVRKVEPEDLAEERLSSLATAPVLFQEYVPGVSVRAFVVGRRMVAAAEIRSSELDYRRDEHAVVSTRLTVGERAAAIAAARACGMAFTGVDFIRHPRGFTVLECNPSPMFAVFEDKTGLDVAGPLAAFLVGK